MTDRYNAMFARLHQRGEGAFVPFVVLGDPTAELSLRIVCALAEAGADALELGIPFSDPVADGPTIQRADQRALAAGFRVAQAWEIIGALRQRHERLPIGLLVYANLVEAGTREGFYAAAKEAGVDSVLVADVPSIEAEPFAACARRYDIAPVLIATPNAPDSHLREIAALSRGYTYVVTRSGVTGAETAAQTEHRTLVSKLREFGAPPPVLGFGISQPAQVRNALAAGAAGAISGSAVVQLLEDNLDRGEAALEPLKEFITKMKDATRLEERP